MPYGMPLSVAFPSTPMPPPAWASQYPRSPGVAAIPISAFYEEAPVTHLIRLCFPKRDATLDEGARRLAKARELSLAVQATAR